MKFANASFQTGIFAPIYRRWKATRHPLAQKIWERANQRKTSETISSKKKRAAPLKIKRGRGGPANIKTGSLLHRTWRALASRKQEIAKEHPVFFRRSEPSQLRTPPQDFLRVVPMATLRRPRIKNTESQNNYVILEKLRYLLHLAGFEFNLNYTSAPFDRSKGSAVAARQICRAFMIHLRIPLSVLKTDRHLARKRASPRQESWSTDEYNLTSLSELDSDMSLSDY